VKCLVQLVRARAARLAAKCALAWPRAYGGAARSHLPGSCCTDGAPPALASRQAVHQIAGLRGLFPDDAFKRRDIAGLPNVMELKARRRLCPSATLHSSFRRTQADFSAETRQVCEWIDRGAD